MRPEISAAFQSKQWVAIREMEALVLTDGNPEEVRVLALSKLYTGAPEDAANLFRQVVNHLSGRSRSACLVDGATALAWFGECSEALEWLAAYWQEPERPYDAAAHETTGYCLWKLKKPIAEVDLAYQEAIRAFGNDHSRIARINVNRARLMIDAGHLGQAEELLALVSGHTDVAGYVLGARARIAAKRGEIEQAKRLATEAMQILQATVDKVGSSMEAIARMALLLAELSSGSERILWADVVRGMAYALQMPHLYHEAEALEGSSTHA